jgi:hypothetical protein
MTPAPNELGECQRYIRLIFSWSCLQLFCRTPILDHGGDLFMEYNVKWMASASGLIRQLTMTFAFGTFIVIGPFVYAVVVTFQIVFWWAGVGLALIVIWSLSEPRKHAVVGSSRPAGGRSYALSAEVEGHNRHHFEGQYSCRNRCFCSQCCI